MRKIKLAFLITCILSTNIVLADKAESQNNTKQTTSQSSDSPKNEKQPSNKPTEVGYVEETVEVLITPDDFEVPNQQKDQSAKKNAN